ncbi:hypothetical protein V8C86DRAFT_2824620 [Haematococcus lacustris]
MGEAPPACPPSPPPPSASEVAATMAAVAPFALLVVADRAGQVSLLSAPPPSAPLLLRNLHCRDSFWLNDICIALLPFTPPTPALPHPTPPLGALGPAAAGRGWACGRSGALQLRLVAKSGAVYQLALLAREAGGLGDGQGLRSASWGPAPPSGDPGAGWAGPGAGAAVGAPLASGGWCPSLLLLALQEVLTQGQAAPLASLAGCRHDQLRAGPGWWKEQQMSRRPAARCIVDGDLMRAFLELPRPVQLEAMAGLRRNLSAQGPAAPRGLWTAEQLLVVVLQLVQECIGCSM